MLTRSFLLLVVLVLVARVQSKRLYTRIHSKHVSRVKQGDWSVSEVFSDTNPITNFPSVHGIASRDLGAAQVEGPAVGPNDGHDGDGQQGEPSYYNYNVADDQTQTDQTQATSTGTSTPAPPAPPARNHIMVVCGGYGKSLEKTELWIDLLSQSDLAKDKGFRYLYAIRGPIHASYADLELKTNDLATTIIQLMDLDATAQLVVIPHSSGGAVCGRFLSQLHTQDVASGHTPSVTGRVTYFILDADVSAVPALFRSGIFHKDSSGVTDGLYGICAHDTGLNRNSHNSFICGHVADYGGISKILDVSTSCPARDASDSTYCVHQAVQCTNPGGPDCPLDAPHLESRYLQWLPW